MLLCEAVQCNHAKVRATVGITIQVSVVNASTFVDEPLGEREKTGKIYVSTHSRVTFTDR